MSQYGWGNCPREIQEQVNAFVEATKTFLRENLTGIYLHGSLAMGCFNPNNGDIDLLVVTKHKLPVETKRAVIEFLLKFSKVPSPMEISLLSEGELTPWQYPTPFDLHYSEMWREKYQEDLRNENWRQWDETQNYDEDLAAHITVTSHRGISLCGKSIEEVFSMVPSQDYLRSILSDFEWAKDRAEQNPVYLILNVCRVYAFLQLGAVYSKAEAGVWTLTVLPEDYQTIVTEALASYREDYQSHRVDQKKLSRFINYMDQQIKAFDYVR